MAKNAKSRALEMTKSDSDLDGLRRNPVSLVPKGRMGNEIRRRGLRPHGRVGNDMRNK